MSIELEFGCLFCRTGYEKQVVHWIEQMYPDIKAFAPEKLRYRRNGGIATEERVTLFPGYVFIAADSTIVPPDFREQKHIFRLLSDCNNVWRLKGTDKEIVRKLYCCDGIVRFSQAYYIGDRIHIVDGFLKEYEGQIVKVNHRAKTAKIKVMLNGINFELWLGYELISSK